jgi:hypothetical protein
MAVTESDEVLVTSVAVSPTMPSSSRNSVRLTSRSSITASTTRSQPASAWAVSTAFTRAMYASRVAASILFFSCSLFHWAARASRPRSAAPAKLSSSSTSLPAWAAICAMPRPMAPAPTTPIRV